MTIRASYSATRWNSIGSEETPDRKRCKIYQDMTPLGMHIARLKDLVEDIEVIRRLQRELLQLIKAARGVDSDIEEIGDDIYFHTPV